jgi:hypothetical protein
VVQLLWCSRIARFVSWPELLRGRGRGKRSLSFLKAQVGGANARNVSLHCGVIWGPAALQGTNLGSKNTGDVNRERFA